MTMPQLLLSLLAVTVFLAGLAVLAAWVVQLIILSLTERRLRFLRWAPLAVPALVLCLSVLRDSVIEAGLAGALLLGWGLAWPIYKRASGGDRSGRHDPEEKSSNKRGHA